MYSWSGATWIIGDRRRATSTGRCNLVVARRMARLRLAAKNARERDAPWRSLRFGLVLEGNLIQQLGRGLGLNLGLGRGTLRATQELHALRGEDVLRALLSLLFPLLEYEPALN